LTILDLETSTGTTFLFDDPLIAHHGDAEVFQHVPPRNSVYFIIADGSGTRWDNYLGQPKHLVNVEGQVLLERTIRQFAPHGTVIVIGPDHRYHVPPAFLYKPVHDSALSTHEADRFACHRDIWPVTRRINLLFGDVWFSQRAVELITTFDGPWTWFSRLNKSAVHGCPYGEGFGFSVAPDFQPVFREKLQEVIDLKTRRLLHKNQGWQLYRHLAGASNLRRHHDYGNRVEIDDWTDDFDSPEDYQRWTSARLRAGYPKL
jgi:hypothetical protein